jgi:hypothetical protein
VQSRREHVRGIAALESAGSDGCGLVSLVGHNVPMVGDSMWWCGPEVWGAIDDDVAESLARDVARAAGASLTGVSRRDYAGRPGRVAQFDVEGLPFVFVPGGQVEVGFDMAWFRPTPEDRASFEADARDGLLGAGIEIETYVESHTSRRRPVAVPPLLVAVDAQVTNLAQVAVDHPQIVELAAEVQRTPRGAADGSLCVDWPHRGRAVIAPDGSIQTAWLATITSHEAEVDRLAGLGRRLLSPHEWEYACGGGAPTLFRWGDSFDQPSGMSKRRSLFGLNIGQNPWHPERTADPLVLCGGDGGVVDCGGARDFVCGLPLATSYRDDPTAYPEWEQPDPDDLPEFRARTAIPLG